MNSASDKFKVYLAIDSLGGQSVDFLKGISRHARETGGWLFYTGDPYLLQRDVHDPRVKLDELWFSNAQPSGLITSNIQLAMDFVRHNISSIVTVNCSGNGTSMFPRVELDYSAVGATAVRDLLGRGYRHFAFYSSKGPGCAARHQKAFEDALAQAGHTVHLYDESNAQTKPADGQFRQLSRWLGTLPTPAAVFTCDDYRGQEIIEACKMAGVSVPHEIAVLGVNNDAMVCNLCRPQLSSIALDMETAGYESAGLLYALMRNEEPPGRSVVIKPQGVVTRQSTDIFAVQDDSVNEALIYIHRHIANTLQVSDVVEASGLSRRRLQEKFYNTLGRSIHDEIKRIRIEQLEKALIETDLSVQQIARKFGFKENHHISRFFKTQKGMSPTEFRERYASRR